MESEECLELCVDAVDDLGYDIMGWDDEEWGGCNIDMWDDVGRRTDFFDSHGYGEA